MTAVTGFTYGDTAGGSDLGGSHDALFGGRVSLEQPARGAGYRVNVDAVLLAAFASGAMPQVPAIHRPPAKLAFDLGAGVGGVALSLLHFGGAERVALVEIDPQAAAMARRNLADNGWAAEGDVLVGDVRDVARERRGEAQLVVCNPPYVAPGRGRLPQDAARARARSGPLGSFVSAARDLAGKRARVCFVYPAQELSTLTSTLRAAGLGPKRLRAVHATRRAAARIVLVEALPAKSGGLTVLPPLVERDDGKASDELEALLSRG